MSGLDGTLGEFLGFTATGGGRDSCAIGQRKGLQQVIVHASGPAIPGNGVDDHERALGNGHAADCTGQATSTEMV